MHRTPTVALLVACSIVLTACGVLPAFTAAPSPRAPISERGGLLFDDWPANARPPGHGASSLGLPAGFREALVFRDLNQPTAIRFLPDGRVLVSEQRGVIQIFPDVNTDAPQMLLDHRAEVFMRAGSHQGLLGLAIDPDFELEPYVYVLYTRAAPIGAPAPLYGTAGVDEDECPNDAQDCVSGARLSRFRFESASSLGREQVLVEDWCANSNMHSIGAIAFTPDGALLASGSDGAAVTTDYGQASEPENLCGDPPVAAGTNQEPPDAEGGALRNQDLRTRDDPVGLNGTIIRVDRATGDALPDNPLADDADENARRIVAYGLRNPFRFAVRPGTSDVWIADVGWQQFEEVNRIFDPLAGPVPNFGWPCFEGPFREPDWEAVGVSLCQGMYASEPADLRFPTFSFSRSEEGNEPCATGGGALTALAFYDGEMFPDEYDGALFLADHQMRCLWVMSAGSDGLPNPTSVQEFRVNVHPIDIQVGPDGAIYYVDRDASVHRIYR